MAGSLSLRLELFRLTLIPAARCPPVLVVSAHPQPFLSDASRLGLSQLGGATGQTLLLDGTVKVCEDSLMSP